MTTLKITLGQHGSLRGEGMERVARAERGEDVEDVGDRMVLNFEDASDLARVFSSTNIALLRAIRKHEPSSMRAAADLVDRDIKEVHRNLTELAALNVVEFVEEGRSKRPVVRFDEIEAAVPLPGPEEESPANAEA